MSNLTFAQETVLEILSLDLKPLELREEFSQFASAQHPDSLQKILKAPFHNQDGSKSIILELLKVDEDGAMMEQLCRTLGQKRVKEIFLSPFAESNLHTALQKAAVNAEEKPFITAGKAQSALAAINKYECMTYTTPSLKTPPNDNGLRLLKGSKVALTVAA